MGLLDGGIAAIFGAAFGGVYLDGTLHVPGTRTDDDEGVPAIAAGQDLPASYQPERVTESMRRSERYTALDARFLILTAGPAGAVPQPTTAHRFTDKDDVTWAVVTSILDPAASHWDVHATPIMTAPAEEP